MTEPWDATERRWYGFWLDQCQLPPPADPGRSHPNMIQLVAMNPYDSPKSNHAIDPDEISPAIVERLIAGSETEDLVFYDVSDHQLYGRKNRIRLTGDVAKLAEDAGCDPIVYQSVLWWCLVFIPVVPLGVFAVIPKLECDDPDGDADQYRGIRMAWDWSQIGLQYGVVFGTASLLAAIAYRLWFAG